MSKTLIAWKKKLKACNKYYLQHGYFYNSNPRKRGGKSINCCGFAFRSLYHFGVIPKDCIYAYTYHGRIKGSGAGKIKKLCTYKIIDMPIGKAIEKGLVLPGDIVGYRKTLSGKWAAHTEVYAGKVKKNGKTVLKFYNYGPDFKKCNGVNYRPLAYKREVGCVIRIKNLDRSKKTKKTEAQMRQKVVSKAASYVGVRQGSSKHKSIVDIFNKIMPDGWAMTYSAPWCACFASAISIMEFGIKVAEKYFPLSANCGTIITKAKKMGIWKESDAYAYVSPGDWILYDWDDSGKGDNQGSPDHVGIVEKLTNSSIVVIEGNKGVSEQVGRREIQKNGRYIRGFVVPKYADIAKR